MATHAPSAGNTQGWAFVVLEDDDTALFWEHEAESSWLAHPSHPGLLNAPVIVLPLASKPSYMERYSEPDKAKAGAASAEWAVPYWLVDTSFATMLLLLGLTQEGLGSLFFALQKPAGPFSRRSASPTAGNRLVPSPSAGRAPTTGLLPLPTGPANPWPRSCTGVAGATGDRERVERAGSPGRRSTRRAARLPARLPARMRLARNLAFLTLWSGTALLAAGCGATSSVSPSTGTDYVRTVSAGTAQVEVVLHIASPHASTYIVGTGQVDLSDAGCALTVFDSGTTVHELLSGRDLYIELPRPSAGQPTGAGHGRWSSCVRDGRTAPG